MKLYAIFGLALLAASCASPTSAPVAPSPMTIPGCPASADRGIGGTGIVGIITGFGSICVAGLEVAIDAATEVGGDIPGITAASLRLGQVVVIDASGGTVLHARRILVRHEVSGPIEAIAQDKSGITVAGQSVRIPPTAWGAGDLRVGDWVDVSGMPLPDGSIHASRLDSRLPGNVLVRGGLAPDTSHPRINGLRLRLSRSQAALSDQYVAVSGRYVGTMLVADRLVSDLTMSNPPAYFGASVQRMVVQSYVQQSPGQMRSAGGFGLPTATGVGLPPGGPAPAIMTIERGPDGSVLATGVRPTPDVSVVPANQLSMPGGGKGSPQLPGASITPAPNSGDHTGRIPGFSAPRRGSHQP